MPKRSARKIIHARPVCISNPAHHRQLHLVKLFRTNSRGGRFVISSWPVFLCCFQCYLEFRLAFGRVAAARSATLFLVLPALCKPFRRWHCWRCLCRCRFSESVFAPQSQHFFSTVSCRLFATPRLACRTFRAPCANLRLRSV